MPRTPGSRSSSHQPSPEPIATYDWMYPPGVPSKSTTDGRVVERSSTSGPNSCSTSSKDGVGLHHSATWGRESHSCRRRRSVSCNGRKEITGVRLLILLHRGQVVHRAPGLKDLAIVVGRVTDGSSARTTGSRHQLGHVGHLALDEVDLQSDWRTEGERRVPAAERGRCTRSNPVARHRGRYTPGCESSHRFLHDNCFDGGAEERLGLGC